MNDYQDMFLCTSENMFIQDISHQPLTRAAVRSPSLFDDVMKTLVLVIFGELGAGHPDFIR